MAQQKVIQVSGADLTLFHVAARELGDPTQWYRIGMANGLDDPLIYGVTTLTIPRQSAESTDGIVPQ